MNKKNGRSSVTLESSSPIGYCRYAKQYVDAARCVDEGLGQMPEYRWVSPAPAYYLALQSIELSLKAFLLHKGYTAAQVRCLNHDILKLWAEAQQRGLAQVFHAKFSDKRALLLLYRINEKHQLRYIRTGLKLFPSWGLVEPLIVRLYQAVASVVGADTFRVRFS